MSDVLSSLRHGLTQGAYVRSVNYHSTPATHKDQYEQQLELYANHFTGVGESDLATFLTTKEWSKDKPGLIFAFYNGYRNNYDVMKPLLEHYGFTGWFFIPTEFVSTVSSEQRAFAAEHNIRIAPHEYPDERVAIDWTEVRTLDSEHVVASHTKTHTQVSLHDRGELFREIVGAQHDFTRQLGHPVKAFAWLWGGEFGMNPKADNLVLEAGYSFLFSNYKIQRVQ